MKTRTGKRLLSVLLALMMAMSLLILTAMAVTEAETYVAQIGENKYETLAEAITAATDGQTITLLSDIETSETYTIADGVTVTLDMNGKKITATDTKVDQNANTGNYELFYIYGGMTVIGNGTIELTAGTNRYWNAMSTIFHNRGGVLTIENGTFTHKGGTDMAFVVDNSGNYYGDAITNINGGTLTSTYTAIRNRMEQNSHGASGTAYLNISGGTISGTTSAIWAQAASVSETSPATGAIAISGGTIGTVNTARSSGAECMTTISGGTVEKFKGEVGELTVTGGTVSAVEILTADGTAVDYAITEEGVYAQAVAKIGDVKYATLADAIAAANAGTTVTLLKNVEVSSPIGIENKGITLDLGTFKISPADDFAVVDSNNDFFMYVWNNPNTASTATVNITNGTIDTEGKARYAFYAEAYNEARTSKLTLNTENLTIKSTREDGCGTGVLLGYDVTMNLNAGTEIITSGTYSSVETSTGPVLNVNNDVQISHTTAEAGTPGYNLGPVLSAGHNSTINVFGGTIGSNQYSVYALPSGGTINISGGTFTGDVYSHATDGNNSAINISGGTFTGELTKNGGEITIIGGTFTSDPTSYVATGYKATASTVDGETVYTVAIDTSDLKFAAAINGIGYETLPEAIVAAQPGEVVELLQNVTLSEILVIDKAITLEGGNPNGGNFTITSSAPRAINVSGADGVAIQNLIIEASGERAINIIEGATNVTINNVEATAANYTVNVAGSGVNAKVTIKKSKLTGLNVVNVAGAGSEVTITDTQIICNDVNAIENYAALCLNKDATNGSITANGVTFNIMDDSVTARNSAQGGTISVNGSADSAVKSVAIIEYGDYYYAFASLKDAVDYATEKDPDATIKLIRNIELTESVTVPEGVTLDLNGKTITLAAGVVLTSANDLDVRLVNTVTGYTVVEASAESFTYTSTINTYTITFDATTNGGSCGTASTTVDHGSTINSLPSASKGGYWYFNGWYTEASGGTRVTTSTVITASGTLYAQFYYSEPYVPVTPPTTTETTENEDGSTTTTVTDNKTGTVTETTTNTDGSTTTVETQKDGTVTETVENTDGSTQVTETKSETTTNTDGSTTTTTTSNSTTTDASGATVTETKTEEKVETETGSVTTSTTEVKSEDKTEVTETTTESTVKEDGSTETKTESTTTATDAAGNVTTSTTTATETTTVKEDGSTESVKEEETVTESAEETTTTKTTSTTTATEEKTETVAVTEETVTKTDGTTETKTTTTTETALADGTTGTAVTDESGKTEATVTISEEAAASEEPVSLPIPAVSANTDSEAASTVTVTTNSEEDTTVEIPVAEVNAATVAVIVNEDGTETVITETKMTEDGLVVDVPDGATVKIVDNSTDFEDVEDHHWEEDAIDYASARGLVNGVGDNLFDKDGVTTRAHVVTLLARLAGVDTTPDEGQNWYDKGHEWAVANGITYEGSMSIAVSRQSMFTMMWRMLGAPESDHDIGHFTDTDGLTRHTEEAARWAVEIGLIQGHGDGTMDPNGTVTRGQLAQFLMNFIQKT